MLLVCSGLVKLCSKCEETAPETPPTQSVCLLTWFSHTIDLSNSV